MVILTKILYKFQMIPVALPQTYFKILKGMISKFIWQNNKPKTQHTLLSK